MIIIDSTIFPLDGDYLLLPRNNILRQFSYQLKTDMYLTALSPCITLCFLFKGILTTARTIRTEHNILIRVAYRLITRHIGAFAFKQIYSNSEYFRINFYTFNGVRVNLSYPITADIDAVLIEISKILSFLNFEKRKIVGMYDRFTYSRKSYVS